MRAREESNTLSSTASDDACLRSDSYYSRKTPQDVIFPKYAREESNPQPLRPKRSALSVELRAHEDILSDISK